MSPIYEAGRIEILVVFESPKTVFTPGVFKLTDMSRQMTRYTSSTEPDVLVGPLMHLLTQTMLPCRRLTPILEHQHYAVVALRDRNLRQHKPHRYKRHSGSGLKCPRNSVTSNLPGWLVPRSPVDGCTYGLLGICTAYRVWTRSQKQTPISHCCPYSYTSCMLCLGDFVLLIVVGSVARSDSAAWYGVRRQPTPH